MIRRIGPEKMVETLTAVFRENVRRLRKEHGLTQVELADAAGISQPSISRWERENRPPELDTVCRLAHYFKLEPLDLFREME